MAALTIAEQDRLIRREWPFRASLLDSGLGLWHGRIFALSRSYEISILYATRRKRRNFEFGHSWFPEVRVIDPPIGRRAQELGKPIPHVYDELIAARPPLCLFDPLERGWDASMPIAETTIPWAADWLRFYEAWQATGQWHGGGRDHVAGAAPPGTGIPHPQQFARVARVSRTFASSAVIGSRDPANPFPAGRLELRDLFAVLPRGLELGANIFPDPESDHRRAA